jgi:Ca2+-binding RTX toxin-like protein
LRHRFIQTDRRTAATTPTTATCHGLTATNAGTAAGEIPMGAAGRPAIQCLAGNDVIGSLQGNGVLCGGMGDDIIYGGLGND